LVWREAPTSTSLATLRALTEAHPERAQIWQLVADAHAAAGELNQAIEFAAAGLALDRWKTPYFSHKQSESKIEIISAGPDRRLWSSDDIRLTESLP